MSPFVARFFQRCRFVRISAGVAVGTNELFSDTAFPPLAAGVLLEAGGFECIPGYQMGQGIEQQQIGFELADFVDDLAASAAFAGEELPAGAVDPSGAGAEPGAAPDELSALRPWFFGGCPRLEVASHTAARAYDRADAYASGGASIGAAWVTRAILQEPTLTAPAAVAALTARAKYQGPERRTPAESRLAS